jgi:hypothetical protein
LKKQIVLILALLLLSAPHAQGQSVGVGGQEVVEARASWTLRNDQTKAVFRFVNVYRTYDPIGSTSTFAALGKTRCRLDEDGNTYLSTCTVTMRIIFFKPQYFSFDPFLGGASVVLKDGTRTHVIKWRPKSDRPSPDYVLQGGERSLVFYGLLRSQADAKGRVLGKRFSTLEPGGHAALSRGVEGTLLWDTGEERSTTTYRHRSRTRAEAWRWIGSLSRGI